MAVVLTAGVVLLATGLEAAEPLLGGAAVIGVWVALIGLGVVPVNAGAAMGQRDEPGTT